MIMIYGPAGAGKSTQGRILAEYLGRKWLSAGQIIRDSGKFDDFTSQGKMIDEEVLVDLIRENVELVWRGGKEVVFDGQPGSAKQVDYLEKAGLIKKIEAIVRLEVSEKVLLERLKKRGRADDNEVVWREKFEYFEQKIYTFLNLLKAKKVPVLVVNGEGEPEQVAKRILVKIEELVQKS